MKWSEHTFLKHKLWNHQGIIYENWKEKVLINWARTDTYKPGLNRATEKYMLSFFIKNWRIQSHPIRMLHSRYPSTVPPDENILFLFLLRYQILSLIHYWTGDLIGWDGIRAVGSHCQIQVGGVWMFWHLGPGNQRDAKFKFELKYTRITFSIFQN